MARIAIVGVGAIGGALARTCSRQPAQIIKSRFASRRPLETLSVYTPQGEVHVKGSNVTDPSRAEPVDWVIVATKDV